MFNFFTEFTKPQFWLDTNPLFANSEILFYLILFSLVLILSVFLKIFFDRKSKDLSIYQFFSQNFFSYLITCVIIGFVLSFFQWQHIPYFSNRIIIMTDLIIILVLFILMIINLLYKIPQQLELHQQKQNFEKYIPQPRKK